MEEQLKDKNPVPVDPIVFDLKDEELADTIDKRRKNDKDYYTKEHNLYKRRKENEKYALSRQIRKKEETNDLREYEVRYLDPAIYEIEASIKPLAMSRLPDMMVVPSDDEDEAKTQQAEDLTRLVDSDVKSRQNRITLGVAVRHHPIYFTAIIKCIWDADVKDYRFINVHPDNITLDHTCPENDADLMGHIIEDVPTTVGEVLVRFPKAKAAFIKELEKIGIRADDTGDIKTKDLDTPIFIEEVWTKFREATKDTEDNDNSPHFEEVNGVVFKYKKCILNKVRNPNWDWEGEEKWLIYEDPQYEDSRREVDEKDILESMIMGTPMDNVQKDTVYRNYFSKPRKPYFVMGYDQYRRMPIDETSRIEQNIYNQRNLDDAGKQLVEKMKLRKKNVFSTGSGLDADTVADIDMNNPLQDIVVNGDLNQVHKTIDPEPVTAQEFKFLDDTRHRMYSVAGATAVRGELQSDVATTNQIAREADYTRADDVVEDTVNAACEWMAGWAMQMIKLRYDDTHFKRVLGKKGDYTYQAIKFDMVDDGMNVFIKASGTDKLKTKNQAMEMAQLGLIDPISYYEDLGISDPKGRAEKLLIMQTNPMEYLTKYVMGIDNNAMAMGTALNGVPPMGGMPQATPPQVGAPMQPSPQDTAAQPELQAAPPAGSLTGQ